MGSGQGDAEMLGVHHHKVTKELLNLQDMQVLQHRAFLTAKGAVGDVRLLQGTLCDQVRNGGRNYICLCRSTVHMHLSSVYCLRA